jgi:DNA mismatch repair protein MutL
MPIAVLGEQVVNQIAAGEVIERPASVVKELVENALDAGARRIQVTLERGGSGLVRVTDDGEGIAPAEVHLAFARHATSKLRQVEDLWALRTLGFRGEALPSIAAVARVTLTTRPPDEPFARRIQVTGGAVSPAKEAGAPPGTTVEVRDLFFNTPARRKFLKSEAAEAARIALLLTGLAVVHPAVAFTLVSEGRTILSTTGSGDLREALTSFLGGEAAERLLPVAGQAAGLAVSGYSGSAGLTWANRSWELFAVNGRLVESRLLQTAVEKTYTGLLPGRRFPVAFLHLEVDPGLVDVNVHPAKREVRFRREGDVFQAVHRAVAEALTGQPLYRSLAVPSAAWPGEAAEAILPLAVGSPGPSSLRAAARPESPASSASSRLTPLRYLGQLAMTYLVAEIPGGLVLVDQHAAHERVIFNALRSGLAAGTALPVQTLLWPAQVELTPAEAQLLADLLPVLTALGFALEPFGGRSVLVRAVPVLLARLEVRQVLAALVGEGEEVPAGAVPRSPEPLVERLLPRLACRAAVQANQALAPEEAEALLDQWQTADHPWTCPHGRPVALRWPLAEVAAAFLRR